ncbi:MAG: autotransporter outer membrane beta-barrel domain-containing protein [Luteolibacter sp.]
MKSKYLRFVRSAFPTLIVMSSTLQFADAAAIATAGNGSLVVSAVDNGANRIVVNGGVTPVVTILSGTVLTPDGTNPSIILNSGGYHDSSFNGVFDSSGIPANVVPGSVTPSVPSVGIITNAGILSSNRAGLEGNYNTFTFYNTGSLSGATSGIREVGDGSIIVNVGSITGANGSGISGTFIVPTADNVTVHNTGTISGNGTLSSGIVLADDALIINSGSISATGSLSSGISVADDAVIYNLSGGSISGVGSGIFSTGDSLTLNNWGTVTGTSGLAISGAALGADLININAGSVINGAIAANGGADVVNISADYTGNTTINGSVLGGLGADEISVTADAWDPIYYTYVNGAVTIDGNVDGGTGADIITLAASNLGTIEVTGDVEGGAGADEISLTATSGGSITVDEILGDSGDDLITLSASGIGSIVQTLSDIEGGSGADIITLEALNGGVVLVQDDIWGDGGDDTITLRSTDGYTRGSVVVLDDVGGGSGYDILNLEGGLATIVDPTDLSSATGSGFIGILGDVDGIEEINKTGEGTAFITGYDFVDNVVTDWVDVEVDAINVNEGGLYINGWVWGSSTDKTAVTVNGGEIGGTGHWEADVVLNAGTGISAGQTSLNLDWDVNDSTSFPTGVPIVDAIGDLEIHGSLTVNDGAFIRYDLKTQLDTSSPIAGNGDADLIYHWDYDSGDVVTLGAGSSVRLSPTSLDQAVSDGRYVIIESEQLISGAPLPDAVTVQVNANVADAGGFAGSLVPFLSGIETANLTGTNLACFTTLSIVFNDVGGESLVADVQHNYAGLGLSANQASIGAAIDSLVNSPSALVQDFISALDLSNAATAVATLASLSPEAQLSQAVAVANSGYRVHHLLRNHSAAVRADSTTTVRIPVGITAKGETVAPSVSSNRGNVWGAISYDWQDYDDDRNVPRQSYDGEAAAVTAGFDWRVAPQLVLGVLVDASRGDYDYDNGSDSEIDSARILAYGTFGGSTGLYSDFAVGYGHHDLDSKRALGGLLSGASARSSTEADSWQATATVGYAFGNETFKHGPFGGLEYQNIDVDGYNERGILPVRVDGYSVDSLRGLIGYRVDARSGRFTPYASVAYAHEFKDDDIKANGSLAGAPFQVRTSGLGSAILVGLGSGYAVNDALTLNLGYRAEISVEDDGLDSHGLNFGANWKF